jgi:hypothetical protein
MLLISIRMFLSCRSLTRPFSETSNHPVRSSQTDEILHLLGTIWRYSVAGTVVYLRLLEQGLSYIFWRLCTHMAHAGGCHGLCVGCVNCVRVSAYVRVRFMGTFRFSIHFLKFMTLQQGEAEAAGDRSFRLRIVAFDVCRPWGISGCTGRDSPGQSDTAQSFSY